MRASRSFAVLATAAVLVVATSAVGPTPVLDAETGRAASDALLVHSAVYTMLAPLCNLLDALTLLSLRQHYAVLATVMLTLIAVRGTLARSRRTSVRREATVTFWTLGAVILVYGGGAIVPRPMAGIAMLNPDDVVIDFHSHTNFSWDARQWFTARRNREWHRAAGYNVAYVSDHRSLDGARIAMTRNPARAGDGVTLLPALEARDQYQHVIAIGIDTTFAFDPKGDWHDPPRDSALAITASAPILILTVPGNLSMLPQNELRGYARLYAVELSDGAPKGIGVLQQRRADILKFADTLNLALVAGSDNHGWGRTAAGWSVMRIPRWTTMRAPELDSTIQRVIRIDRRHAVRVYVRDSPNPGNSVIAAAFTVPLVIWRVLVDLDWPERISWLGWIVLIASIAIMPMSRAARETTPPAARRKPEST
ncbi:MAG: hypothetical protein M3R65_08480 [Gemmatimonadota bacterium]|nr:hypothetical protein [Gemmatimonadota bacterium]